MPAGLLSAVGLYGKLPATGDFVALGLEAAFRQHMDRWVSLKVMPVIEAGLFPDGGLRFLVPSAATAGAMVDSRDRVGRRYPLIGLVAAARPEQCNAWIGAALAVLAAARDTGQAPQDALDALAALEPVPGDRAGAAGPLAVWTGDRAPAASLVDLLGLDADPA